MKLLVKVLVVGLGLVLGGCNTPSTDARISVDPAIWNSVQVAPVVMARTADHFLIAQANVYNRKKCDRAVEYRIEWLDENGVSIHSVTDVWIPIVLAPKETRGLKMVSPTVRAADCRFLLRASSR